MKNVIRFLGGAVLMLLFWLLIFDFQRVIFIIHNFDKVNQYAFTEWIQVFVYSFRLDLSMASYLSTLPLLVLLTYCLVRRKSFYLIFKYLILFELLLVAMVQAGEINAYPEWNHKLTPSVFVHFLHIDEIFRTADYSMTLWFVVYTLLQLVFGWRIFNWLFSKLRRNTIENKWVLNKLVLVIPVLPIILGGYFLLARGGWQQIPINIDAASFSQDFILNDISINSTYFFGKSFLLYRRADIGKNLTNYSLAKIDESLHDFLTYDRKPEVEILKIKKPNIVFVILEGWSAAASNLYTGEPGATPVFDSLAKQGLLFRNIYATGTTSEVGNSTILSGYLALPEIFITMQPQKNKPLKSINQSLKPLGYSSGYLFSGDLKYGSIESYLINHDFDRVEDENVFPKNLKRGKLNYYDEDLFNLFLERINQQKQPFMECAFTGSTHSPYDCPPPKRNKWTEGKDKAYMNSLLYSNESIERFIDKAKKQPWFKNTLFIFVADHGHSTPYDANPYDSEFFNIPLLFYGEALKEAFRGKEINTIGSQADIAQTLLQQLGINAKKDYPWSKNLLSKNVPPFALHAIPRGFGWVTPEGRFTYSFDYKRYTTQTFPESELNQQRIKCNALMQLIYEQYKTLDFIKTKQ